MEGGTIGEIFTALAFASALVSMLSFWVSDQRSGPDKAQWITMGKWGFRLHALSILGIIGTLFALIYTHNYSYHYVWSHSSNELPVYYMISCFWEGQEGSFLLWCFWHSVLGLIVMRREKEWTPGVMAVIASVELILTSMLLGVYLNGSWVSGMYVLAAVLPGTYMAWRYARQRTDLPFQGNFHLATATMAGLFLVMMVRGQLGFDPFLFPSGANASLSGIAFWLYTIGLLTYSFFFLAYLIQMARDSYFNIWEVIAGAALIGISVAGLWYAPDLWKAGSTPFIKLKSVFPNEAIYLSNPDFVPSNGTGLNPLLQNYWMVIHPPTLFLGFASTLIPFAFVMAGLIRKDYTGWIKPSLPWASFSVMILGIGIIMGGYWAYETLNFGGYWNWDPVENSSLVPWLCGVASLHAMLIYRKTKAYLKMAMILIISTFILVLYSTFLTRSGILGETSVHTFTDLGLSGQLLVLLLVYVGFVVITMVIRWRDIPQRADESKLWSAEFMLFIGILIFAFSSLVIILATSLPVINAIFGSNFAPPAEVQLFYYKWNVWFAILFGVASGIGQFLWWNIKGQKTVADALFRPFLLAVLSGSAILLSFWLMTDLNFAYDPVFAEDLAFTKATGNSFQILFAYVNYAVLSVADELLLFSALFGLFANLDVLIRLLIRNRKGLKVMGGTVVHIGFAFMLLGMLFSSGYDDVVSINYRPSDLAAFPEEERNDNVLLPRGYETPIKGYRATYEGKLEAQVPVSGLQILEENALKVKLSFRDVSGDRFITVQPRAPYLSDADRAKLAAHTSDPNNLEEAVGTIDLEMIERLLNRDLALFEPERINSRTLYGVRFRPLNDPEAEGFLLYPEAELNQNAENAIISHPSRKVHWNRDLYVYTSSLPDPKSLEPKFYNFALKLGDTLSVGDTRIQLLEMRNLTGKEGMEKFDVAAAAHLMVINAQADTFLANPVFLIEGKKPGMISSAVEAVGMEFAFVGVQPENDLINIQVRHKDPQADFVVIKAINKPFINLLWLGTFLLAIGFMISIYRRVQELNLSS